MEITAMTHARHFFSTIHRAQPPFTVPSKPVKDRPDPPEPTREQEEAAEAQERRLESGRL